MSGMMYCHLMTMIILFCVLLQCWKANLIFWCHYIRSKLNRMSTHGLLVVILLLHVTVETGSIIGLSYLVVSQNGNCFVMHVIG